MTHKTLIIFDWDDTLFPTTLLVSKGIDLSNPTPSNQYISLFTKLDNTLFNLLSNLVQHAQIAIVTNAVKKWVDISLVTLPKSKVLINKHIPILSARDLHKQEFPKDMKQWKRQTFKKIAETNKNFTNIISVGDAEYEYLATIDLYDKMAHSKKKLLKTIRLFPNPSFESLINQLDLLSNSFHKIISCNRHLDLKFNKN